MKVYFSIEGVEYTSDSQLARAVSGLLDRIHIALAQKLRYQIMWSLRSLEKEIEEAGGAIIIDWDNIHNSPHIYCKGMGEELAAKINEIAVNTDLQ
jgi:hypothetical protein